MFGSNLNCSLTIFVFSSKNKDVIHNILFCDTISVYILFNFVACQATHVFIVLMLFPPGQRPNVLFKAFPQSRLSAGRRMLSAHASLACEYIDFKPSYNFICIALTLSGIVSSRAFFPVCFKGYIN